MLHAETHYSPLSPRADFAFSLIGHLAPQAESNGISPSEASFAVGLSGLAQIGGRIVGGIFADQCIGRRNSVVALCLAMSATIGMWNFCTTLETISLLATSFGFFLAAYYTAFAGMVHDHSGENFAEVYGIITSTAALPGTLFSSPLYGMSVDQTGNCELFFRNTCSHPA